MKSGSNVSSKGQVTIPLAIRKRLGVKEGDRVEFVVEDGKTILQPARGMAHSFKKYVGALPHFGSRAEIKKWISSLRDDPEYER